jgi:hypothetical protein
MKFLIVFALACSVFANPKITLQPNPRVSSVSLGMTLKNSVGASSLHGPITNQWRFNGVDMPGKTFSILTIVNAKPADSGVYTCVVSDADGSTESLPWTVDVDPTFTKILASPTVALPSSGGVAWGDLNNDGFPELMVAGNPTSLFSNQLGTNFIQNNAGYLAGLNFNGDVALADYDNDGWTDLLLTSYGGCALVRNVGGIFSAAPKTGLPPSGNLFGSAWADYDRDGFVDAFFTCGFTRAANSLYRNTNGVFKLVSASILSKDSPEFSQGPAWGDYDNDGWPDLFVANGRDYNASGVPRPSYLYHNLGNGNFEKVKNVITTNLFGLAMGIWADFNNDRLLDLFACGYAVGSDPEARLLFRNEGGGNFSRVTVRAPATDAGYDQGAAAIDYDNDGWLDIFIASGGPNAFNDALYRNNGDGTFTRITRGSLVNDLGEGAGCAWGDFNHDGFLDLYVSNFQNQNPEKNGFYINNGNANHWLEIKCVGRISNRSAIGAKVRVRATIGGKQFWQLREIASNGGYMAATPLEAHFGLGDAASVEQIRIEWPSGIVQEIGATAANQFLTIEEPPRLKIAPAGPGVSITPEGRGETHLERSLDLLHWEDSAAFAIPELSDAAAYFRLK